MTEPKTLAEWEADGAMRFVHGDKIPYPTRDKYTAEEETAFLRGFRKAQVLAQLSHDNCDSPLEFD